MNSPRDLFWSIIIDIVNKVVTLCLKLAGDPSQSDVIVEGKNYVNGYHFCYRLSPKQNFVSLHHTIIWRKVAFVFFKGSRQNAVRICGPTKAAFWLVESGPRIVVVVSAVAVSQRDA